MKLLQFILIAIFLLCGIASCKKWKGDENKEVTYGGGRVVLINSETPVPSALVSCQLKIVGYNRFNFILAS